MRRLATLGCMALALSGCPGSPVGEDAELELRWWIYGQRPDDAWCDLAGISDVRLVEDGDPIEGFEWPCAAGEYVSSGPVLAAGEYFFRFEGIDDAGYVVASSPGPESDDHVTVEDGARIVLDQYDLDAGGTGDLAVPVLFRTDTGREASCAEAGVDRIGYEFSVDACGEDHGRGAPVYADVSGGGVDCADLDLSLSDVPFGVYTLTVTAFATGASWTGECADLALEADTLEPAACVIERTK